MREIWELELEIDSVNSEIRQKILSWERRRILLRNRLSDDERIRIRKEVDRLSILVDRLESKRLKLEELIERVRT